MSSHEDFIAEVWKTLAEFGGLIAIIVALFIGGVSTYHWLGGPVAVLYIFLFTGGAFAFLRGACE